MHKVLRRIFVGAAILQAVFASSAVFASKQISRADAKVMNSLGMLFREIDANVYLSIYETRVRDYEAFVSDGGRALPSPSFVQAADHPVVNVSWEDAQRFCAWLTKREYQRGALSGDARYRLPTEAEWMRAAGIAVGSGKDLAESRRLKFAWGEEWPPPDGVGNYGPVVGVDEFAQTAPVGSFPPNSNGFYDLGGNVWEWCFDSFEGVTDIRVLKGSSWRMREPSRLALNRRIGNPCGLRLPTYGFRVILDFGQTAPSLD